MVVSYCYRCIKKLSICQSISLRFQAPEKTMFGSMFSVYSPDMPKRLPLSIVFSGFLGTVAHAVRFWLHYTVVAIAWLGVVPLTACRSGSHYMSGGGGR